ncbi:MAG: hypothetical protein ACR2KQ_08085 [Actinomycetota bacterium]
MRSRTPALRLVVASMLLLFSSTACTSGINAGEQGGVAFIALAGMLIVGCVILWFVLGREE